MGDGSPLQDQLQSRLERARRDLESEVQLQRGDHALAEPLFAELFKADPGRVTETDLIIAEGCFAVDSSDGAMEDAGAGAGGLETPEARCSNESVFGSRPGC